MYSKVPFTVLDSKNRLDFGTATTSIQLAILSVPMTQIWDRRHHEGTRCRCRCRCRCNGCDQSSFPRSLDSASFAPATGQRKRENIHTTLVDPEIQSALASSGGSLVLFLQCAVMRSRVALALGSAWRGSDHLLPLL
nr:hypothetical protein CFP56_32239 [Quercus suber]